MIDPNRWGERYTEDEDARIERMWADGVSLQDIADALGRSRDGLWGHISRHRSRYPKRGAGGVRNVLISQMGPIMTAMREHGCTSKAIAATLGVCERTVRRHLGQSVR